MKCKYDIRIWGQVVECLIEDCEQCRFNPNLTVEQVQDITDKHVKELLNTQEKGA